MRSENVVPVMIKAKVAYKNKNKKSYVFANIRYNKNLIFHDKLI